MQDNGRMSMEMDSGTTRVTGADDCPEVPGSSNEATVFGCIDRDQDGWAVLIDALPDESTQWSDEDSDGYGDEANGNASDACPGTPIGVEVDDRGCSAAQRDTDGDGIFDAFDQCPNEAQGPSMGLAPGCPPEEVVSDDGLFASLPLSPVTLGAAGGGVLIVVLVIVVLRLRAREDDEEDWYGDDYEEDEDEEDEAPLSFLDRNPRRTPEPAPLLDAGSRSNQWTHGRSVNWTHDRPVQWTNHGPSSEECASTRQPTEQDSDDKSCELSATFAGPDHVRPCSNEHVTG